MRLTIDTKEIANGMKKNLATAKEKVQTTKKKKQDDKNAFMDDLAYLKVMIDWNVQRLEQGKDLYIPEGMDHSSIEVLKTSVSKVILASMEEDEEEE